MTPVNRCDGRSYAAVRCLAVLILLHSVNAGCSAPRAASGTRQYLMGVAYDVEPVLVREGYARGLDLIRHDFQATSGLGFDLAMLRHLREGDLKAVLEIASEEGLKVSLTDQAFQHYVRTGVLPPGVNSLSDLAHSVPRALAAFPALSAIVVEAGRSPASIGRSEALRDLAAEGGVRCVLVGGRGAAKGDALVTLDTRVVGGAGDGSALELWLARYHRGLIEGRTGGIVYDRYRRLPGDGAAMAPSRDSTSRALAAAIKELRERASQWGPRLIGARPEPLRGCSADVPGVTVTAFIQRSRRYVLVFNEAVDAYGRGEVVLPELIFGKEAVRAVEVPSSRVRPVGRVVKARGGRIVLDVSLRPGDAVLFEIF